MPGPPLNERVASLEAQIDALSEEVRGLKRSIWGTGFAIVAAVVIYLFKESAPGKAVDALSHASTLLF